MVRILCHISGVLWKSNGGIEESNQHTWNIPWVEFTQITESTIKSTFDLLHSLVLKMASLKSESLLTISNGKNIRGVLLTLCTDVLELFDVLLERPGQIYSSLIFVDVNVKETWGHFWRIQYYLEINFLIVLVSYVTICCNVIGKEKKKN